MREMKRNVVLIGFMGSGKSSIGRELASRMGCAFVDIDHKIEENVGMRIPEIFEKYGEEHFRACEREAVREVANSRGMVIATGGGTVKDPENVKLLRQKGVIICLTANVDTILARTSRKGKRPLLDAADKDERRGIIERLMEERKGLYSQADYQVDTSERSPFQIIEDIHRFLKRRGI